jgi:glutamyl-tRNA reductase
MPLVLVGTSHRLAPVELRERMSFEADESGEIAARVAGTGGEAVALGTCNRACLYVVDHDPEAARRRAVAELERLSGLSSGRLDQSLYVKLDDAAAHHLFRVASGLDSLVPGEAQILGQVRSAYEAADAHGATGPVVHRLFRQALHTGRRVRNETAIGETPASVSAAAAGLAARLFDDLRSRRVLIVGAGKMGELAAADLITRGVGSLVVANRSAARGAAVAERLGGRAAPLESLPAEVADADVVIASTGSQGFVLTASQVEEARRARRGEPVFFIDIAVPRDLDPAINDLDGCFLYDIDDLERVVEESVLARRDEATRAEAIVGEEADAFRAWRRSLEVVPAIASLRRRAEEIRTTELERALGRLEGLSPRERLAVESLTSQIVNKLLHLPTVRLKEAAAAADGATYAETVRHLFDLPDDKR